MGIYLFGGMARMPADGREGMEGFYRETSNNRITILVLRYIFCGEAALDKCLVLYDFMDRHRKMGIINDVYLELLYVERSDNGWSLSLTTTAIPMPTKIADAFRGSAAI